MEDVIEGRWCQPRNTSTDEEGTVHHPATARRCGYEGGLVPAAVHLEQFTPLLLHYFGADWWRHGCLSVYVVSATVDREPVCCYLEPVDPGRALVWLHGEGESLILRGSAALSADPNSEVAARLADRTPAAGLRLLHGVQVGAATAPLPLRIGADAIDRRLAVTTERETCYRDAAEFGGRVVPMAAVVRALETAEPLLAPARQPCVRMEGALELQHLNGPVLGDRDYLAQGQVLAVAEDARAEELWYRVDLTEAGDRRPVASMIRLKRLLKAPAPLTGY